MKATVNRKELVKALKYMKELSKQTLDAFKDYQNVVALYAKDGSFSLVGGPGHALAFVTLSAEVEEEGIIYVPYKLLDFAKAASRDENLVLSGVDVLSISGPSKFKARLSSLTNTRMSVERAQEYMLKTTSESSTLLVEDVQALIDMSKVLDVQDNVRWVSLLVGEDEGMYNGMVQKSSNEALEEFPLKGTGNLSDFIADTHLLTPLLVGRGTYITISRIENVNAYRLEDPDDPNWWGMLTMLDRGSVNA